MALAVRRIAGIVRGIFRDQARPKGEMRDYQEIIFLCGAIFGMLVEKLINKFRKRKREGERK